MIVLLATAGFFVFDYFRPARIISNAPGNPAVAGEELSAEENSKKAIAERIKNAEEKSAKVKGVYMTSIVANDNGRAATKLRGDIVNLIDSTELNAVVIDVKETDGGLTINDRTREIIKSLHDKGVWAIARQVVFKDSSQEKTHPEWYLKRKSNGGTWRDRRGGSWLDMASKEVWDYQLAAAKAAADAGFDEIQFDYIRFPSDGNIADIAYPVYDGKREKYEVMRDFFKYAHDELKGHKPDLIISADLFGYVALQHADLGIGQRLADIGENFDYISLMVYPSHYYSGFQVAADSARKLGPLYYPYQSKNIAEVVSSQPYNVVYRSLLVARDTLDGKTATTTTSGKKGVAISTAPVTDKIEEVPPPKTAKLRPWLQDFDLGVDSSRGIYYDAKKVRAQIDAAEAAGSSGWLLWSANNVYTKDALKPE